MNPRALLLCIALGLTGCRSAPGTQARGDDPACHGRRLSAGRIRLGDNVPVALHVTNDGRRCWWGFGLSGLAMAAARVVAMPSHGTTILRADQDSVAVGYLPRQGFVGQDDFLVDLPALGYHTNLAVTVYVAAQPAPGPRWP